MFRFHQTGDDSVFALSSCRVCNMCLLDWNSQLFRNSDGIFLVTSGACISSNDSPALVSMKSHCSGPDTKSLSKTVTEFESFQNV